MMIYTKALLALCVITQVTAFVVQTPPNNKAQLFTTRLASTNSDNTSPNAITLGGPNNMGPSGVSNPSPALPADVRFTQNVWNAVTPTVVQGNSLKTFNVPSDRVQVLLKTNGRPLNSKIELWHGPDYTPYSLEIFLEDGSEYPFNAVIDTPYSNSVACYNKGDMEFPMSVCVEPEVGGEDLKAVKERLGASNMPETIQGGALKTYPFADNVKSVQVLLRTDGRHLQAKIELLHGPNNRKQTVDIYSSDGQKRSFYAVFETPDVGCVVRIINKCTVEYPLNAVVQPFLVDEY